MQLKKILSMLTGCALLTTAAPIPAAAAATTVKLTGADTVKAGDTLEITVEIEGNTGYCSSGIILDYGEYLEPILVDDETPAYTLGPAAESLTLLAKFNPDTHLLAFATMGTTNNSEDGNIITFAFTVPEAIFPGEYEISLTVSQLVDYNGVSLDYTVDGTYSFTIAQETTTSTTTTSESTTTTTTSASTTTTTTSETTTTTTTTETTTTTTTTETTTAAPVLSLNCASGFPGGTASLQLQLENNPGVEAMGIVIQLPSVLTPQLDENGNPMFNASSALNGNAVARYNATDNRIALTYATEQATDFSAILGSFSLKIASNAVIGTDYPISITLDSFAGANGVNNVTVTTNATFTPTAPTPRTLSQTTATLTDQDETLQLTLSPEAPAGSCTWYSPNPAVATVDENGLVTAKGNGTVVIEVTCETLSYYCTVNVDIERKLNLSDITIKTLGSTCLLYLEPAPAETTICTWRSSNEAVATVDQNGLVTAKGNGTAVITVAYEGEEQSCNVTVIIERTLNATAHTFTATDETLQLTLTPGSENPITWESSNSNIATVDANGLVTPVSYGTATITATCESVKYTCEITVQFTRTLNLTECMLTEQGATQQLALEPVPTNTIVWSSSDPQIASVDANGLVTALNTGVATITAKCEDVTYTCTVTVQITRTLNKTEILSSTIGETHQLKLNPMPTNAVPTWSSDNEAVATVNENGIVTIVSEGTATVTAVCEGVTYTCTITVQTYVLGDVIADGAITAEDAVTALKAYIYNTMMGTDSGLTATQTLAADVTKDGNILADDANYILQYYVYNTVLGIETDWDSILA